MTDPKTRGIAEANLLASQTGEGVIHSNQQQSQSKKPKLRPTKTIELLSSDDGSDENSTSSSFPSCTAHASPGSSKRSRKLGDRHSDISRYASTGNADATGSTNNDRITDTSSNSTASKKILDKFLKANAGADSVKEALELHQMMMESDDDSSSTGSDFGQLWGLSAGVNIDTCDNPEYESSTEDHVIDSESDSGIDSSIEIITVRQPFQIHSSPVGHGMNGRHLSGRQRRLEAARSKNSAIRLYGENSQGNDSSDDHDGNSSADADMKIIREDEDDNNNLGGDDDDVLSREEADRTNLKPRALLTTEAEECNFNSVKTLASSAEAQVLASIISEKPTSDIENMKAKSKNVTGSNITGINSVGAKTMHDNKSRLPEVSTNASVNKKTNNVSKEIKKIVKGNGAAAKSISKTRTSSTLTKESGVFDNLFCNGKDFFAWAGITDPNDFLRRSKDYAQQVNLWRKDRNLPLFNDTIGYTIKLRRQIRDNMKSILSRRKKHGSRSSVSVGGQKCLNANNKSKKRKKIRRKTIYPSMKDLPMEGGDFMAYMGIKNIEDVFKRSDLHKHINEWRKKQKLALVNNERSCIASWRKWIRKNLKHHTKGDAVDSSMNENPPDEIDFSNCMELVSSLSKRFLNRKTGLPVYQFAVYDTLSTDIIYEFRVEAKPSLIPNAGNGAFLTFLGAREAPCPIDECETTFEVERMQTLVSKDSEGYHMNIKVVGEHLQGNNERMQYPPPTSLPPIHEPPEEREIHASKYPWTLNPEGKRLLSQYVENSEILFSSDQIGCLVIELGRYGPFRRSDRKFQLHYDLKNFIFSNETSEWGFDVMEDLNGHEQVADVTDDTTGMPHYVAKQNISMYVNETGGDPELKQTVWSGQMSNREVNYYFKTEKPIQKGETIELLISYFGTYDEIRERKGYGERNKRGDVRGDDHFPSFLERNFVERYDMVEVIYEVEELMDLYMLSEFLEKIRSNLARIVDTFIGDLKSSSEGKHVPYVHQIIALRRLSWLKPFFLKKIESLQKIYKSKNKKNVAVAAIQIPILLQCASNAKYLNWESWPILMDLLDKHPKLVDGKGLNMRSKFREEVTEDICYGISGSLFCPCNEAIWCDVASTLTHDLCYMIARDRWNDSKTKNPTSLSENLMQKAIKASEEIQNPKMINQLKFDTDIWKRYALNNRGAIAKEPRGSKCVMTLANDCKGPEKRLPVPLILRGDSAVDQTRILKIIHKPWYLMRQIIFVVDTFAQSYLVDDKSYSLEILCQKLGVVPEATCLFLKRDIELDLESSLFYGKDFVSIYSTGNKINPRCDISIRKRGSSISLNTKKKTSRTLRTPVRKLLFWDVVVKRLQESGWSIERGSRPTDWYLLPPGVSRGKGYKPRVDFFDSAPLAINCLKTDIRYCNLPVIKAIMEEYGKCQIELENMKLLKSKELKNLSNEEIVDHLRKRVNIPVNKSDVTDGVIQNDEVITVKVVFHTERLGLLLYIADNQVLVKGVTNLDYEKQINSGDAMIAVGENSSRNKSLAGVCELVRRSERPLTITFERRIQSPQHQSLKTL